MLPYLEFILKINNCFYKYTDSHLVTFLTNDSILFHMSF